MNFGRMIYHCVSCGAIMSDDAQLDQHLQTYVNHMVKESICYIYSRSDSLQNSSGYSVGYDEPFYYDTIRGCKLAVNRKIISFSTLDPVSNVFLSGKYPIIETYKLLGAEIFVDYMGSFLESYISLMDSSTGVRVYSSTLKSEGAIIDRRLNVDIPKDSILRVWIEGSVSNINISYILGKVIEEV